MKINQSNRTPAERPDTTNRIGLWVSLGTAAAAALAVLAVAFYTDYQEAGQPVRAEMPASVPAAPSVIPTSEAQAASIAAATSDEQSKGMTAPSDVGGEQEAAASASAASDAVPVAASEPAAASGPARAILAEEYAAHAETRVVAENGVVRFYFTSGKSDLAANTLEALKETLDGVRAGKKAVIASYADADTDAALTKERASAVRSVLLAAGVPVGSIEIREPETGGGNSRVVEVVLR